MVNLSLRLFNLFHLVMPGGLRFFQMHSLALKWLYEEIQTLSLGQNR